MTVYVDIDNTICVTHGVCYEDAKPLHNRINRINELFDAGHKIVYWTARGSGSGKSYTSLTWSQLVEWDCKFHELQFSKPVYDLFICDKAINAENYFR